MNDKTDRASEIMKQMEFVEQLTQKLNRAIYLGAETAIANYNALRIPKKLLPLWRNGLRNTLSRRDKANF